MPAKRTYDDVDEMLKKYIEWMKTHDNMEPRLEIPETDDLTQEEKQKRQEEIRLAYWMSTNPDIVQMLQKYRNNKYVQNIPQQYRSAMELCRTVGLFFPEGSKEDKFSIFIEWIDAHEGKVPRAAISTGQYYIANNGKRRVILKKEDELTSDEKIEVKLGRWWNVASKERQIALKYSFSDLSEINDELDKKIVKICREHGLGQLRAVRRNYTFEDYIRWLDEHDNIPPRSKIDGKMTPEGFDEITLAKWWKCCPIKNKLNKYVGIELDDISDEKTREMVRVFRERKLEKYVADQIDCDFSRYIAWIDENKCRPIIRWLDEKGRIKSIKRYTEQEKKGSAYARWWASRPEEREIFEQYQYTDLDEIPEEYKELVSKCKKYCLEGKLKEYSIEEYIQWMKDHDGEKPREYIDIDGKTKLRRELYMSPEDAARARTEDEEEERHLAAWWRKTDEYKLLNKYFGVAIEDIPEEDKSYVEQLRNLGLDKTGILFNFQGYIKWVSEHNNRYPRSSIANGQNGYKSSVGKGIDAITEEEAEEKAWGQWWQKPPEERTIIEKYIGQPLKSIPEIYRGIVEQARNVGIGIIERKREVPTLEAVIEWRKNNNGAWPHSNITTGDGRLKGKYTAYSDDELLSPKEKAEVFVGSFISRSLSMNRDVSFEEFGTIPKKEQDIIIYIIRNGRPMKKDNKLVIALKQHPEFIESYQYQTYNENESEIEDDTQANDNMTATDIEMDKEEADSSNIDSTIQQIKVDDIEPIQEDIKLEPNVEETEEHEALLDSAIEKMQLRIQAKKQEIAAKQLKKAKLEELLALQEEYDKYKSTEDEIDNDIEALLGKIMGGSIKKRPEGKTDE